MTASQAMTVPEAVMVLSLPDRASLNEIHARYRDLVREWHPDVSMHDPHQSHEMFIRVREAYMVLAGYCMNYRISFRPEDIRADSGYDSQEFWMNRFGDDPIWG